MTRHQPEIHLAVCETTSTIDEEDQRQHQRDFDDAGPGSTSGAPLMRPDSLGKAMIEPVNVDGADGDAERHFNQAAGSVMAPRVPMSKADRRERRPRPPRSTAAMPTSEWNAATSCGIAVIWTRRAITAPTAPPIAQADRGSSQWHRASGARQRVADRDHHTDHAEQVALRAR